MPNNYSRNSGATLRFQREGWSSSGARTATPLNSVYVHRTSGAGIAIRLTCQEASPINEALVFVDVITGAAASVTMRARLYNPHTTNTQPGTTLLATATTITFPTVADRWMRIQFGTPYTPARGEVVWLVIDNNSAAPATNFPSLMTATSTISSSDTALLAYSSTNGFSTAGTLQSEMPALIQLGSNWYGNPVTQTASSFANNQLKRGLVVIPPINCTISSIQYAGTSAINNLQIYESTQLPSATALHTLTPSALEELTGTYMPTTDITLYRGKKYYVVLDFATNNATPGGADIEDYATVASVFNQMVDGFSVCCGVQEQAGNTWTEFPDIYPTMFVNVKEIQLPTVTFSG